MQEHGSDESVQVGRRLHERRIHCPHANKHPRGDVEVEPRQKHLDRVHDHVDRNQHQRDRLVCVPLKERAFGRFHHALELSVVDDATRFAGRTRTFGRSAIAADSRSVGVSACASSIPAA